MREAIELSVANVRSGRGGPFAAVIVKNGRIIAKGTNLVTSTNDPTAHAEIVAMRKACRTLGDFQLTGCDIYTSCEPCPMCMAAIYWARPARVFYGNTRKDAAAIGFDDFKIFREIGLPLSKRAIPMIPLMRKKALRAFRAWEKQEGKIAY